eukprot:TRINITY_DN5287_c0_g2_i2.p1 TRINITY_DN5287_c0_g2~~TRINITY_DN5287_c0_g2_i2.p1  ORF type:complete len:354 (-),score=66.39 TRINITY_DN5287_c0_g2_i2:22-1083(-)
MSSGFRLDPLPRGTVQGSDQRAVSMKTNLSCPLYDAADDDTPAKLSWQPLGEDVLVPRCDVSWQHAVDEWGRLTFKNLSHQSTNTSECGHGVHNPLEALWWKYCKLDEGVEYVWFVESDAFFTGDVADFLLPFEQNGADLVSASFRIAGEHWWNFPSFHSAIVNGKNSLELFSVHSDVVENVHPLPTLEDGPCHDDSSDFMGVIFRQDVVERWSKQLFEQLTASLEAGVVAPGEAFLSTLCASALFLPTGLDCTMYDWAPVLERREPSSLASPAFCWSQELAELDMKTRPWCTAEWAGKWIHPVKTKDADFLDCGVGHSADDSSAHKPSDPSLRTTKSVAAAAAGSPSDSGAA